MTHERMYQKMSKTHENKVPTEVENRRKTLKTQKNTLSKTHTKIRVFQKTKKTEKGSPADQNHLVF